MHNFIAKKTVSAREVIRDLSFAKPTLLALQNSGKAYNVLINEILITTDTLPKIKTIHEKLNITPSRLKKWLDELHTDFLEYIQSESASMSFQSARVCFCVYGPFKEYTNFYCRLPVIPRIGEAVSIPFINALVGQYTFYVNNISYELEGSEVIIFIYISTLNPFVNSLLERAKFEGKISFNDAYHLLPFELEDRIKGLYRE